MDRVRETPSRGVRLVLAQEYRPHLLRVNGPVDSVRAQHVPGRRRLRVRELQPVDVERPGRAAEGLGDDVLAESRVVVVDADLADVAVGDLVAAAVPHVGDHRPLPSCEDQGGGRPHAGQVPGTPGGLDPVRDRLDLRRQRRLAPVGRVEAGQAHGGDAGRALPSRVAAHAVHDGAQHPGGCGQDVAGADLGPRGERGRPQHDDGVLVALPAPHPRQARAADRPHRPERAPPSAGARRAGPVRDAGGTGVISSRAHEAIPITQPIMIFTRLSG